MTYLVCCGKITNALRMYVALEADNATNKNVRSDD